MTRPSFVALGLLLSLLDLAFIAFGIAWMEPRAGESAFAMFRSILRYGLAGSLVVGALLGLIAGITCRWPVIARLVVFCVIASAYPYLLCQRFDVPSLSVVALIPTTVAMLILEKHTRAVRTPRLPRGQARSE